MAIEAVIFDVDGTLVDTNESHVEAWRRAFVRLGYTVTAEQIRPEIGKGGDKVVPDLLGPEVEEAHGAELREAHGEAFLQITAEATFSIFPGVVDLLTALHARGLHTALATSSKQEYLAAVFASAGVDLGALVDEVATSDEAEASKPDPDIVLAAAGKLDVPPAACLMVGDTPHDAEACLRSGVGFIGLRTGGWPPVELIQAGAISVWADPADLLAHLDEVLAAPHPVAMV